MSQSVGSPIIPVGRAMIVIGLVSGWMAASPMAIGQEASSAPEGLADDVLLTPSEASDLTSSSPETIDRAETTPSFEELDSAASDLNDALSGARAKLDELRQATELAAMAAELREELEDSIQENNRLAASLAELQSDRSDLASQNSEAQRKISELTETVEASQQEIVRQAEELQQREDEIDDVDLARSNAELQVRQLEAELVDTSSDVDQLRDEIGELSGQLEATRTELDDANGEAELARVGRDDADRELSKVRKQIAGMLRSVLLGGEPIDVSSLEEEEAAVINDTTDSLGLGVRYEAIRASNVRASPDPESARVGFAKRGDLVTVLGKVSDRNWFEVETIDGIRGFIFGDLIRPGA